MFFSPFGIFCSGRGSFLVLSAPWHTGSPPGLNTQDWAPAEVRGACSGGRKWHVRSGKHSEHVEPSRPMQTHVHNTLLTGYKKNVRRLMWYLGSWMSSMSSDITYLVMENFFSDNRRGWKNVRRLIHVQVERTSDGSHVMHGILNVVDVVRHYLLTESLKECPGLVRVLIWSSICHHTAVHNVYFHTYP